MSTQYTVGDNEWLLKIALDNFFLTTQPIKDANPGLAQQCSSDFDVIAPGTVLTIPDIDQKDESAGTSARHTYQVKTEKKDLVLTIQTADAKMIRNGKWEVTLPDGTSKKGDLSSDPIRIPDWPQSVTQADLQLIFLFRREPRNVDPSSDSKAESAVLDETIHLNVGGLDPLTGSEEQRTRAVQKLLINLGYYTGEPDSILGPHTRAAIHKFRLEYNVPDSEELLSADTINAIVDQQQVQQIGNSKQSFQAKVRNHDKPLSLGSEAKADHQQFTTFLSDYYDPREKNVQKSLSSVRFFPKNAHVALSDSGTSKNPNIIRMKWRKFIFIDNGRWTKKGRDFGVIYGRHVYLCSFDRDATGAAPSIDGDDDRLDKQFFQAMGASVTVSTHATAWWAPKGEFDWTKLLVIVPDMHLMTIPSGQVFRGATFKLDPELDLLIFAKRLVYLKQSMPGLYAMQLGDSYDLWVGCEPRLYKETSDLSVQLYAPDDQRWVCAAIGCPGHKKPNLKCSIGFYKCSAMSCMGMHMRPDDPPCRGLFVTYSCGRGYPKCGGHPNPTDCCSLSQGSLWFCNKTVPPCPGHPAPVRDGYGVQSPPCPDKIDPIQQLVTWIGEIRGTNCDWVGDALGMRPVPGEVNVDELAQSNGTHLNPACAALELMERELELTYLHGNHDDYLILGEVSGAAGLATRYELFERDGILIEHGHRLEKRILASGGPIPANYDGALGGYKATLQQFHDQDQVIKIKRGDSSWSTQKWENWKKEWLEGKEDFADWAAQKFQQTGYIAEYAQVWVGRACTKTYPAPHIFGIGHTHDPLLTYVDIRLNLE